jgi:hypothetical protein
VRAHGDDGEAGRRDRPRLRHRQDGAGIAGLWYYEALGVPAAAADTRTAEMGNGADLYQNGTVSRVNDCAQRLGLVSGMAVRDAVEALLTGSRSPAKFDPARRLVVHAGPAGRSIVCTDSIADALHDDRERNVLCTAGHTGRSVVDYFRRVRPWGFICSDGGSARTTAVFPRWPTSMRTGSRVRRWMR